MHVDVGRWRPRRSATGASSRVGRSIAPETARRLGCDAGLVRIIERDGRPLSVGRRTRTVPPALKRALNDRDPQCRFPGCDHRRYLHAHHIHHWARRRTHQASNLIHLCSYHHRLVHEGGFITQHEPRGGVTVSAGPMADNPRAPTAHHPPRPQHHRAEPTMPNPNHPRYEPTPIRRRTPRLRHGDRRTRPRRRALPPAAATGTAQRRSVEWSPPAGRPRLSPWRPRRPAGRRYSWGVNRIVTPRPCG